MGHSNHGFCQKLMFMTATLNVFGIAIPVFVRFIRWVANLKTTSLVSVHFRVPTATSATCVNYYTQICISDELNDTQICISDVLNDAICTKFATSRSLRHAFNISSMHQNFGQWITVSQVLKKCVQKLHTSQE